MRMFLLSPQIGPVRFGVSVSPEDFPVARPAPPADWRVRFAVAFALILPVFTLGLLAERPYLGPGALGGFYGALAVFAGSVYAGVRIARYTPAGTATILRWCGTALGALILAMVATAFVAAATGL